ncbi:hypothetical protein ABOM_006652 [Aspergillus bombycis]|uniref:Beta/gamma crystallin 'Greek key' domain-containing protein n=1 Tax=Aspergillus bombycis TaxID=109264 RepID=A0A1F8A053_9EURO|nr:hypothetical protein ABOM_006652 [Aspergillus bombycis]OGM45094.1 hypothetical protein ABOM_006652 [Aspergillus bombycis]
MRFTPAFLMLAAVIGGNAAEGPISIQVCNGINHYPGSCTELDIFLQHQCYNLNGTPVVGNVRSVSIPAGYRCRFWESSRCNGGGTGDIQAPGIDVNGHPQVKSVKCYPNN